MAETVFVGRNKRKLWKPILGVMALLVVATAAGVGVRLLQNRDDKSPNNTPTTVSGISQDIDDIQTLRSRDDAASADQIITEALEDRHTTDKEKYQLYIQQGNILADKQDYNGAIASYTKSEALDTTFEITSLLGDTYKAAGNKEKAIEYYKKAIPLVPASPLQDDEKASLEQKIADLESQP